MSAKSMMIPVRLRRQRNSYPNKVANLLNLAGISIGGNNPWDIQVNDEKCYSRLLAHGSLGLGESYVDVWWDCEHVDEFIISLVAQRFARKIRQVVRIAHNH